MGKHSAFVRSDAEIIRFEKKFTKTIFEACKNAGLCRCDWDAVKNSVLIKYGTEDFAFDPEHGAMESTLVYRVAHNAAIDEIRRRHDDRFQDLSDTDRENIKDARVARVLDGGEGLLLREALKRFTVAMRDRTKVEVLVRYMLNGEGGKALAKEYGFDQNYAALQKTRYWGTFLALAKAVQREDEEGCLKLTDTDISFLKPYLKR